MDAKVINTSLEIRNINLYSREFLGSEELVQSLHNISDGQSCHYLRLFTQWEHIRSKSSHVLLHSFPSDLDNFLGQPHTPVPFFIFRLKYALVCIFASSLHPHRM